MTTGDGAMNDYLKINKETAQPFVQTLRHAGLRHETRVRLGKQANLHVLQTVDNLLAELISYRENGTEEYRLKLRTPADNE